MRGGYKIIDLQNKNITTESSITIDGIYDSIESTQKPILVENIIIDEVDKKSLFVEVDVNENSNYVFTAYNYTFTITDEDTIVLEAIVNEEVSGNDEPIEDNGASGEASGGASGEASGEDPQEQDPQ